MRSFRRITMLALGALMASLPPNVALAQEAPVDPVSGLPIPLMPGQFFNRTANGCGVISDIRPIDYSELSWIGSCKYGVVDGDGIMIRDRDGHSFEARAELGYFWPEGYDEFLPEHRRVFVPRTTSDGPWKALNILHRTLDDEPKLFDPRVATAAERLVLYETLEGNERISEELWVWKNSCPTYAYTTNINIREIRKSFSPENDFNDLSFSASDVSRLSEFCLSAVRRLKREGYNSFDNLDYGHYHFASVQTVALTLSLDGQTVLSERTSKIPSLCPDLATPLGCEAVWQGLLATYIAKYEALKPQEAALRNARRAEAARRFAPLSAAWRNRILALTASAPGGGD